MWNSMPSALEFAREDRAEELGRTRHEPSVVTRGTGSDLE
jgi:hypothetical protein